VGNGLVATPAPRSRVYLTRRPGQSGRTADLPLFRPGISPSSREMSGRTVLPPFADVCGWGCPGLSGLRIL